MPRRPLRTVLRTTLILATLLASGAAPARAQSAETPNGTLILPAAGTTVPLLPGLRPVVDVTINGHGPFRMLVETGSAASYLLPENYARVFAERTSSSDTLRIGTATLTGIRIRRHAQLGVPDIDGLIGLDALFDAAVTFDFPARVLRLTKDTLPAANDRDVLTLGATSQLWTVPMTLDNRQVNAILDTQSALSISADASRVREFSFTSTPAIVGQARGPTIGNVPLQRARLSVDAVIGDARLQQPLLDLLPLAAPLPPDAFILGLQVLSQFAVTLDQRVGRIRFARETRVVPPPPPVYATGLSAIIRPDGLRFVLAVADNSAAAEAGIKPGEVILRLDGRAMRQVSDTEWRDALSGSATLKLRVSNGFEERNVQLTPRYLGF
jgi:hypothetical protein